MTEPRGHPARKLTGKAHPRARLYDEGFHGAARVCAAHPAGGDRAYLLRSGRGSARGDARRDGAASRQMLDTLVQLALAHGSTVLADHLRASIKQHGQPKLTAVTFRMVTEAAQLAAAAAASGSRDRRLAAAARGAAAERRGAAW